MRTKRKTNRTQVTKSVENLPGELRETEGLIREPELTLEHVRIAKWLKKIRFRKKLFRGVSEQDVWKKMNELNSMYEAALTAERVRYDTLIDHYKNSCIPTETGKDESAVEDNDRFTDINHKRYTERYTRQRKSHQ